MYGNGLNNPVHLCLTMLRIVVKAGPKNKNAAATFPNAPKIWMAILPRVQTADVISINNSKCCVNEKQWRVEDELLCACGCVCACHGGGYAGKVHHFPLRMLRTPDNL